MPAFLHGDTSNREVSAHAARLGGRSCADIIDDATRYVDIGLLNNTADAALEATERQFLTLLDSASGDISVRLWLYTLPEIPHDEAGRRHVARFYSGVESLWSRKLDGLIVSGREPLAVSLRDEPYWGSLTRTIGWAAENTHSTIWSCLGAHAAILHLDGIVRRRCERKRCGVMECTRLSDHALLAGLTSTLRVPHSRWNDIPESELTAHGYNLLTRTRQGGVDTFVKDGKSLFVFFQGHPEYESDTLLMEYRRDVARYFRDETDAFPSIPENYFDEDTVDLLTAHREEAISRRGDRLSDDVTAALSSIKIRNTWHSTASHVYRNWLKCIERLKIQP